MDSLVQLRKKTLQNISKKKKENITLAFNRNSTHVYFRVINFFKNFFIFNQLTKQYNGQKSEKNYILYILTHCIALLANNGLKNISSTSAKFVPTLNNCQETSLCQVYFVTWILLENSVSQSI